MTKICFLSSAHPKFDKRVFKKQACMLAAAGHDVSHICPDAIRGEEIVDGVCVKTYMRKGGLVGRVLNAPKLYSLARREKADVLHANELDSWLVALVVKLTSRTKVVFDVHEFYPSMFAETRMPKRLAPLVKGAFRLVYRVLGPATDLIVLANRYIRNDFPKRAKNTICVENFGLPDNIPETPRHVRDPKAPFQVIHVGLMAVERGSMIILDACDAVRGTDVRVQLIGQMADISNDAYRGLVKERGLGDSVEMVDWMPFDDLLESLRGADAGFVFFQSGSETNAYGLPHKLFDYMAAGLPVLVSEHAHYVAEIVREADCGIVLNSENEAEIVTAIERLKNNPKEAHRLGVNGQNALRDRFNWNTEIARLVAYYDTVTS